jgi:selenocysteine lyase/cysteine desulfurase
MTVGMYHPNSTSLELDQPDYMPDRLESGTLNTVGILTLEAGIRFINKTGIGCIWNHETALCNLLISGISCLDGIRIYRDERISAYLPIVLFNIDGLTSNETANLLSDMGFALRGGLHCAGLAHTVIGTIPDGGVRFSPSVFNTENEVKALINAICQIHNSI